MKPFIYKDGVLNYESLDIRKAIGSYSGPVYIGIQPVMAEVLNAAEELASSGRVRLFVSVKTNDDETWLRSCCRKGFGLEVVSRLELEHVLRIGCCDPENIIYNGPAKSADDIAYSCSNNIGIINIDSCSEAMRIMDVCRKTNKKQIVGIRLCLNQDDRWNKFGIVPGSGEWVDLLNLISSCEHIQLRGLHIHSPLTMSCREKFHETVEEVLHWATSLVNIGFPIRWLDLGGGKLPNDYNAGRLLELGEWIGTALSELSRFDVYLEPGKALVNDVFLLATKCMAVKERQDGRLLIFDAGVNAAGGRHANMGYPRYYPLHEPSGGMVASRLCGPMCFPTDVIDDNVMLPEDFGVDDILIIPSCGAYTLTLRWKGTVEVPAVIWAG